MNSFKSPFAKTAFEKLQSDHGDMNLTFDEYGVYLHNFDGIENESGWSQEQIENSLSDEMALEVSRIESENQVKKAAAHFIELYAEEIQNNEVTEDAIYEWWTQTKDQYEDDVAYEDVESEILSRI